MPARKLISEKMAEFLSAIAHQHRIRIIEELQAGEQNVNSLQAVLGTSHSVVSQHLSILRANKVVKQRKEGTQVHYQLIQPELANWLLQGLVYLEGVLQSDEVIRSAINEVKSMWGHTPDNSFKDEDSNR